MKKLLLLCAMMLTMVQAVAIPAVPKPANLRNAQGAQLDVRLHGDEFYHYYTTSDGYTVLRNEQGGWDYARKQGDKLVSTGVQAHNESMRSPVERQLIAAINKRLTDASMVAQAGKNRAQAHGNRVERFNYKRFRGLIILIEYTDMSFGMSNPKDFYTHMVCDRNYTGYTVNGRKVNCPGSVRDYYYDQSGGMFDPAFDVVGPVRVNYASTAHRGTSGSANIFSAAMKAVDDQVDYTRYDGDGDGTIDMVFFIGAGPAACYEGNDDNLLWPHKHMFVLQSLFTRYDGMRPYDYACATEIYGWQDTPSSLETQGIGVICHEFSHVLGLQDHYDADYTSSGGECHTPGWWDIMADAPTTDAARTPPAYSLYERWSLGWCNPTIINKKGIYTLNAIDGTSEGCILRSPDSNEYFTLENRQNTTKWDKFLPGHGMLITRVDSSDVTTAWGMNKVNVNPSHMHLQLLRAWNNTALDDLDSDPFPGTKKVTSITNNTSPNLITWSGKRNAYNILNIRETGGKISFEVVGDGETSSAKRLVETFDKLPLTMANGDEAMGDIAKWKLTGATIANYNSSRQVSMTLPSAVQTTTPLYYNVSQVEATISNSGSAAKFSLYYSIDGGSSWTVMTASDGSSQLQVGTSATVTATWDANFDNTMPVLYRIVMVGGSKTAASYIDNFTIYYEGEAGEPEVSDTKLLETFEKLPTTLANGAEAQGDIAMWKLGNSTIVDYNGSRQVSLTLPSLVQTTTPLYYNVIQITAKITNPQTTPAKLALYGSDDNGATWNPIANTAGESQFVVDAATTLRAVWDVNFLNTQAMLYRLAMVGGTKERPCYVDNFTLYYTGEPGSGQVTGDVNGDGKVDVEDVNCIINVILKLNSDNQALADVDGDGKVDVSDVNAVINIILKV